MIVKPITMNAIASPVASGAINISRPIYRTTTPKSADAAHDAIANIITKSRNIFFSIIISFRLNTSPESFRTQGCYRNKNTTVIRIVLEDQPTGVDNRLIHRSCREQLRMPDLSVHFPCFGHWLSPDVIFIRAECGDFSFTEGSQ